MMARKALAVVAVLVLGALCQTAGATGIMVPEGVKLPPLAIKNHRVNVRIEGNVATTHLSEVFVNSTDRRLEATYIFPIPRDAALTDFAMYINGKRQSGEVVEAGRARQIYQDIVRRMKDPGLLEYMDSGLLRMRVFPIEPKSETKVEVTYAHPLPFESGVYEYTFPLKTGHRASRVLEDFTLTVDVSSRRAMANVYSPTHEVGISRKDDHHALVGFEQTGAVLDTDFTLFYALSQADFGLNLLTHRIKGHDGYFALMLSPRVEIGQDRVLPKDVCFVVDVSGSMQRQDRMASAREAVKFCLRALNPGDRFALITFSTGVDLYGGGLIEVTPEAIEAAVAYVDKLEARGGTDLCSATLKALSLTPDGGRPYMTVLVTDGKPTVGVTEIDDIIEKVEEANRANVRIFTFGIAENLNVKLLDLIAETTRSYSEYVAPGREIEDRISGFFRKASNPVLANLELDYAGIPISDIYPQHLPDLFRGSQVVAFGRYSDSGEVAVELTGLLREESKSFVYDATFPDENDGNDFLPQLWARRKIGYLLDQIRLHGESSELTEEVIRLSQEYGIATPYTSYLVLENEQAYVDRGIPRREAAMQAAAGLARAGGRRDRDARFSMDAPAAAARAAGESLAGFGTLSAGRGAIEESRRVRVMKEADVLADRDDAAQALICRAAGRTFRLIDGAYVDTAFQRDMEALKVKWGSDAYFAAVDALPELIECLALGEWVTIVVDGKALVVADEGEEDLSADEIRAFFAD